MCCKNQNKLIDIRHFRTSYEHFDFTGNKVNPQWDLNDDVSERW